MTTTNHLLSSKLAARRLVASNKIDELQSQANKVLEELAADLRSLVLSSGYQWCHNCDGTGAVERLDSGIMRRFNLREWDGCEKCGGTRETKGRGYI